MAITVGFNPGEVNSCIAKIVASYGNLIHDFHGTIQVSFVNQMAEHWACTEALNYFVKFQEEVNKLISEINVVYKNIYDSVTSAGKLWAETTGRIESFKPNSLTIMNKSISIDNIKENINGIRGIDLEKAKSLVDNLKSIMLKKVSADLSMTKQSVVNKSFLGMDQQSNLINTLNKIAEKIENCITDLIEEVNKSIETTVNKYEDTAGKISRAFSGI